MVLFIFILQPQDGGQQFEVARVIGSTIIPPLVSTVLFVIISLTTQKKSPGMHGVIDYVPPTKDVIRGEDLANYSPYGARPFGKRQKVETQETLESQKTVLKAKKEERIPRQIKYIIVFFYGSILIGWLITRMMLGIDIPYYIVSSESMLPNLKVRDVVIIKNIDNANDDSAFDNLKVGDVIPAGIVQCLSTECL